MRTQVENLVVNQPLSKGALDFRFPEHTLVVYSPPERPDHQRVVLWGADNRPAKEIEGPTDIPGYKEAKDEFKAGQNPGKANVKPRSPAMILWINLALIVVIAAVFLIYRNRQRREDQ